MSASQNSKALGMTAIMISAIFVILITNSPLVGSVQATTVNSDIVSDETWTASNNPYTVTANIVVDHGVTLTIDPGVIVEVDDAVSIEIRGNIDSQGTSASPISFSSSPSSSGLGWNGVDLFLDSSDHADFDWTEFSDVNGAAITLFCCNGYNGQVTIDNSTFTNNVQGVTGYTGSYTYISNSTFDGHSNAINSADKIIRDSTFINNIYAIGPTVERTQVYNSLFDNNDYAIDGRSGPLYGNTITGSLIGVKETNGGWNAEGNTIYGNLLGLQSASGSWSWNNFYSNSMNVNHTIQDDISMPNNYWGTTTNTQIESLNTDIYDECPLGKIYYTPILSNQLTSMADVSPQDGVPDAAVIDLSSTIAPSPDPGLVFVDTTWFTSSSPVIILNCAVVANDVTLTIEPGVEVQVEDNILFDVRGSILSQGTSSSPVRFIPLTGTSSALEWSGIDLTLGHSNDRADFDWTEFSDVNGAALSLSCCSGGYGGQITIDNSTFTNNVQGVTGYTGSYTYISNSTFDGHSNAINSADKIIRDSTFINNIYAIGPTVERTQVYNSLFDNNDYAIDGRSGPLYGNTITGSLIGVKETNGGWNAEGNTIYGNLLGLQSASGSWSWNNFYSNSMNVNHTIQDDISMPNNYWGTTTNTQIESLNTDIYDECPLGKIYYTPILSNQLTSMADVSPQDGVPDAAVIDLSSTIAPSPDPGLVFVDTTWFTSSSPVIILNCAVVANDVTLTIEPGVEVQVEDNILFDVRGSILSQGTSSSPVRFIPLTGTSSALEWSGIDLTLGHSNDRADFDWTEFSDVNGAALSLSCCSGGYGGQITIDNSTFTNNVQGVTGYTGSYTYISNSTFDGHSNAINSADKIIRDSTFINNIYAIGPTVERTQVYNSLFDNNDYAIDGRSGPLYGNTITGSLIGVKETNGGWNAVCNTITSSDIGVSYMEGSWHWNNLYNNNNQSLVHTKSTTLHDDLSDNYWGTTGPIMIENSIYHFEDESHLGRIIFTPFLSNDILDCTDLNENLIPDIVENNTGNNTDGSPCSGLDVVGVWDSSINVTSGEIYEYPANSGALYQVNPGSPFWSVSAPDIDQDVWSPIECPCKETWDANGQPVWDGTVSYLQNDVVEWPAGSGILYIAEGDASWVGAGTGTLTPFPSTDDYWIPCEETPSDGGPCAGLDVVGVWDSSINVTSGEIYEYPANSGIFYEVNPGGPFWSVSAPYIDGDVWSPIECPCKETWDANGQPVWDSGIYYYSGNYVVEWPANSGILYISEGGGLTGAGEPGVDTHWFPCEETPSDGGPCAGLDVVGVWDATMSVTSGEIYEYPANSGIFYEVNPGGPFSSVSAPYIDGDVWSPIECPCKETWDANGQPVWDSGIYYYSGNYVVEWPANSGILYISEGGGLTGAGEPGVDGHWFPCEETPSDGGPCAGFDLAGVWDSTIANYTGNYVVEWPANSGILYISEAGGLTGAGEPGVDGHWIPCEEIQKESDDDTEDSESGGFLPGFTSVMVLSTLFVAAIISRKETE